MRSLFIVLAAAAVASADQICTPGSYFKTDCNTCVCAKDGSASICTEKYCPPGVFNQDGSLKVPLDIIQEIIPDVTEIEIIESQLVNIGQVTYVQVCTPNSIFQVDCNKCYCSNFGTEYFCTTQACTSKPHGEIQANGQRVARSAEKQICKPNEVYKSFCNICACNKDGSNAACTLMMCKDNVYNEDGSFIDSVKDHPRVERSDQNDFNKDGSIKEPLICEPGTRYNDYCNTCICSKDGLFGACTKKYCNKNVFNKDGTLKAPYNLIRPARSVSAEPQPMCEAGKMFKQYCNLCICAEDGSTYACTRMLCDEAVFHKNGTVKAPFVCEPGSHYKNYCNDCTCSEDGLNARCTDKACNKDVYKADGSLKNPVSARLLLSIDEVKENWGPRYVFGDPCEPSKAFYSECNQCVCLNDGKSAFCTLKMCYKFNELFGKHKNIE